MEREAEAGVKLQMQQRDFEWRQKYQVLAAVYLLMLACADTRSLGVQKCCVLQHQQSQIHQGVADGAEEMLRECVACLRCSC